MSAAASLTELLAGLLQRPVDTRARRRAALLLVDWLGCALGALRSPLAQRLRGLLHGAPPGRCRALGGACHDAPTALLWNAALGNVLEMDDVDRAAILHPGPIVQPVALAVAQQRGADGTALLDAVVRGYEVSIRVGRALGRGHYRYWHSTSTAGAFGAAAAAASLFGLDTAATADALGTAGSRSGGLWQMRHEAVPTKSILNAEAARSGLLAAELARIGVAGPRRILEGEQGLFAATAPEAAPGEISAVHPDWLIHTTSLKPWAACRHAHPAIDALRSLLPLEAAGVAAVDVATYAEALRFCDREDPRSEAEARFSLQHAMAVVLLHGKPDPGHFQAAALARPDLAALRRRVRLGVDAEFEAAFPRHYGASVTLHLQGGGQREARCNDAWGDPEWPMAEADVVAKALQLAELAGIHRELAEPVLNTAHALADGASLHALELALAGLERQGVEG